MMFWSSDFIALRAVGVKLQGYLLRVVVTTRKTGCPSCHRLTVPIAAKRLPQWGTLHFPKHNHGSWTTAGQFFYCRHASKSTPGASIGVASRPLSS